MNQYICMIDLKPNAHPLAFARAAEQWFNRLIAAGKIAGWSLQRRKLRLAGPGFGDFMLVVQVVDLSQLDLAFGHLAEGHHDVARDYEQMHGMVERVDVGLYRPYPDAVQVERLALI
ncbi:DUF6614 family protein [Roseinatronobacter alkalisoli]|uniref:DUF4286 family protein n=1 Tax=Roseinatronobacter alkalisoli TaxID=3028235 RepID=A0ABT5TC60_9RHOB|nr:DUF6614 family protein [Roseinatronobacter sp. HJB301]MDD7972544.1 hypothetical protein [Roseinatronobacter sp. HJB301]